MLESLIIFPDKLIFLNTQFSVNNLQSSITPFRVSPIRLSLRDFKKFRNSIKNKSFFNK